MEYRTKGTWARSYDTVNGARKGTVCIVGEPGYGASVTFISSAGDIEGLFYKDSFKEKLRSIISYAANVIILRPTSGTASSSVIGCCRYGGGMGDGFAVICNQTTSGYELITYYHGQELCRDEITDTLPESNGYIDFNGDFILSGNAWIPMSGGDDGIPTGDDITDALSLIDSEKIDVIISDAGEFDAAAMEYVEARRERGEFIRYISVSEYGADAYRDAGRLAASDLSRPADIELNDGGGDVDEYIIKSEIASIASNLFNEKYKGQVCRDDGGLRMLADEVRRAIDIYGRRNGLWRDTDVTAARTDSAGGVGITVTTALTKKIVSGGIIIGVEMI